jgi:triosephosphate isomerase
MAQPEIDGLLIGGASLDPVGFAAIVNLLNVVQNAGSKAAGNRL